MEVTQTEQDNLEVTAKSAKLKKDKSKVAVKVSEIQEKIEKLEETKIQGDKMISERQEAVKKMMEEIKSIQVQVLQVESAIHAYKELV